MLCSPFHCFYGSSGWGLQSGARWVQAALQHLGSFAGINRVVVAAALSLCNTLGSFLCLPACFYTSLFHHWFAKPCGNQLYCIYFTYLHTYLDFFSFFSVMHKKWLWLASGQMEKKWWFLYSCGVSGGQPLPHLCACIPPHRILSPHVKASAMVPGLYWLHGTSLPRVQVSCSAQNSSLLLLAVQNYGGTAQE